MNPRLGVCILAATLSACTGYEPPEAKARTHARQVEAEKEPLFEAALNALIGAGYQVSLTDRNGGLISTNRQPLVLTAEEADCGKEGIYAYIEDERTQTEVSVKVRVEDGGLWLLATIHGSYATSKIGDGTPLACVSTGLIENEIAERVLDLL